MSYLKSFAVFLLFFVYAFLYEKLLLYIVNKGMLVDFNNEYATLFDIVFYIPFIIYIGFAFFGKRNKLDKGVNLHKDIFLILILAISFRIIENPITYFKFIETGKEITLPKNGNSSFISTFLFFLNFVIVVPIVEEFFFRKINLSFFSGNKIFAILYCSLLFSVYHLDFNNISFTPKLFLIFLSGIICSVIYLKYGLLYSIFFHSFYNLTLMLLKLNNNQYIALLNELNFNYLYWLIIFLGLGIFVWVLRKLRLLSVIVTNEATN